MSLQILSDLHLEVPKAYDVFEITPTAQTLALIGDIGVVIQDQDHLFAFLKRQLTLFSAVLFVPGNHEAYHSSWPEALQLLRNFEHSVRDDGELGEFVLLDRRKYRLRDSNVIVLGCSLFSHVPPNAQDMVSLRLNDFYNTREWTVRRHCEAHTRDLAWLNNSVAALEDVDEDLEVIILTHWSPSTDARAVDPRHADSTIGSAFATDLSNERCFKSGKVKAWAFGHTHYNCDFEVQRKGDKPLRIATNQRGYYFAQSDGFDQGKTI